MKAVEVEMLPTTSKTSFFKDLSFIIVAKPKDNITRSLNSIIKLNIKYKINSEVILIHGNNPSSQRNYAASKAVGKYLVFLDNDSKLDDDYFEQLTESFKFSNEPIVIGGISVLEDVGNIVQKATSLLFSSYIAIGPLRNRYNSYGEIRLSNDKELILCNLIVLKKSFIESGGFLDRLYPNEENEFLGRLKSKGDIIHNPFLKVYRNPRKTLQSLVKQMFSYGIGRTNHFLIQMKYQDIIFFIPMIFSIYILVSLFYSSLFLPIIKIYFSIIFIQSIFLIRKKGTLLTLFLLPLLFFICHFFYGIGEFYGFLYKLKVNQIKKDFFFEIKIFNEVRQMVDYLENYESNSKIN
jgi:GT2 family glycosyltransferase